MRGARQCRDAGTQSIRYHRQSRIRRRLRSARAARGDRVNQGDGQAIGAGGLTACKECDLLHRIAPLAPGGKALCTRCAAPLYRDVPDSLDRACALYLAALMLWVMANAFPFVSLKLSGRVEENVMLSGPLALAREGMPELGLLVFLTSILFPLGTIAGSLYVLLPRRFGWRVPGAALAWRMVRILNPWSLVGVFMLGLLVSMVKLLDLADVVPGTGLYAFVGLLLATAAANANMDPGAIWPRVGPPAAGQGPATAAALGLTPCHTCDLLVPAAPPGGHAHCPRCGSAVHGVRHRDSVARTGALLASAALMLIPANLYPVMTVIQFGRGEPNTILSGVLHLIDGGMWPLAMLVFFASFVVPLSKIAVLVLLLVTVHKGSAWRRRDRTLLYRVTEVVGAWSMVDIFLVAILVALVNLGALATVRPGVGAIFFGSAVVLTMLAAMSFDPRLIWDRAERAR
jgi:paraquat-inducible protein A